MSEYARICEKAARAGGAVLREMQGKFQVHEKGPADLVTEADFASQAAIFATISANFPDHRLLGEESAPEQQTASSDQDTEFVWIVDPLDGTTNYVHGLENYCVSVALQRSGEIIVGAIYDPVRDHCYRAAIGKGAFLNETRIHTSNVTSVGDALLSASFSPRVPRDSPEIGRFLEALVECQAIRRLGSAALNLCYVASGKLDGYWATSLKQWDVAAGILIVNEAGGVIADIDGTSFSLTEPRFIATAGRELSQDLLRIFARVPNSSHR